MKKPVNLADYQMSQTDMNDLVAACVVWLEEVDFYIRPGSAAEAVKEVLDRCRVKKENRLVL